MKKTLLKGMALAAVGSLFLVGSAWAVPTLTFDDGTTSVSITDGGLGDSNPLAGVITYIGSVGSNWQLNVTTGQSPVLGSTVLPHMDLHSADNTVSGAGSLKITLADYVDWSPSTTGLQAAVGGTVSDTTGSSATFETTIDGVSQSILGAFGPGAFSGEDGFSYIPATGKTKIAMIATLVNGNTGVTSFDYELKPVPEPATMLLLGTGLVGLAGSRRRKAKK